MPAATGRLEIIRVPAAAQYADNPDTINGSRYVVYLRDAICPQIFEEEAQDAVIGKHLSVARNGGQDWQSVELPAQQDSAEKAPAKLATLLHGLRKAVDGESFLLGGEKSGLGSGWVAWKDEESEKGDRDRDEEINDEEPLPALEAMKAVCEKKVNIRRGKRLFPSY